MACLQRCKKGFYSVVSRVSIKFTIHLSIEYLKAQRNRAKCPWLLNILTVFFLSWRWASFWGKGCFFRGFTSNIRKKSKLFNRIKSEHIRAQYYFLNSKSALTRKSIEHRYFKLFRTLNFHRSLFFFSFETRIWIWHQIASLFDSKHFKVPPLWRQICKKTMT